MNRILRMEFVVNLLFTFIGLSTAHTCLNEVDKEPIKPEPGWMENEVIAGFRVWQILFLIVAGICTLVIVACCFKRCRIPRTRQEIEANHKRSQITLLFRSYLDRVPVEEIDLMWALDVVKEAAEKRRSKRRKKKSLTENADAQLEEEGSAIQTVTEDSLDIEEQKKPQSFLDRIKGIFIKQPPIDFSDDEESNQLDESVDTYTL